METIDSSILLNTNSDLLMDIMSICKSFNFSEDPDITVSEFVEFVYKQLLLIHDSKKLYIEFVKQLVCYCVEGYRKNYPFIQRIKRRRAEYLKTVPQTMQRTAEWYASKKVTIGASENASVFGMNPYSSRNSLMLKKLGVEDDKGPNFAMYVQHGIKYEPVLQMVYMTRYETELWEYGSLIHESYPFISASPDGITPEGVLVEFKAPKSRKPNGIPPSYYWTQMQQQLQVCRLDKCDFVECCISEYLNWEDYCADEDPERPGFSMSLEKEHGIILEFIKDGETVYKYGPLGKTPDELKEWQKHYLEENIGNRYGYYSQTTYWYITDWSNIPVWRDDKWWFSYALPEMIKFWKEYEERKKEGRWDDLIKPKRVIKKVENVGSVNIGIKLSELDLMDSSKSPKIVNKTPKVVSKIELELDLSGIEL